MSASRQMASPAVSCLVSLVRVVFPSSTGLLVASSEELRWSLSRLV
jgi:hypothetical protein